MMSADTAKFVIIDNKRLPLVKESNLTRLTLNMNKNIHFNDIKRCILSKRLLIYRALHNVPNETLKLESLKAFTYLNSFNVDIENKCKSLHQSNKTLSPKDKEITKETSHNTINANKSDYKNLSCDKISRYLCDACYDNNIENLKACVDYMEKNFISINQESMNNYTPLHIAVINKSNRRVIKYLLSKGACPLKVDYDNKNSMHHSIDRESTKCLKSIIDFMVKYPVEVLKTFNYREGSGDPFNSNSVSSEEAFKIVYKIITTATDNQGNTPIMMCILKKKLSFLEIILKYLPVQIQKEVINYRNPSNGNNAIFILTDNIKGDDLSSVERTMIILLIESQADLHMENYAGYDAIQVLKTKNYLDIIEFCYNVLPSISI